MTTTDEQFISDNSSLQTEANGADAASKSTQQIPIITSGQEPEVNKNEAVNNAFDSQAFEIPIKFKNKDGSANIQSLVKSYKELEPLINEKANWTKEKEHLTSELSKYRKTDELSYLSNIGINFLEEELDNATDMEKAKSLIEEIKKNPSEESIKELESLFPTSSIKNAYLNSIEVSRIASQMKLQNMQNMEFQQAESYLKDVVGKNYEVLKNPIAADIFNEAFIRFGTGLDSEWFFAKLSQLKEAVILDYQKSQSLKTEKDGATSNAAKLSPNGNVKGGTSLLQRNALELSPQELDRMLDEFYSK